MPRLNLGRQVCSCASIVVAALRKTFVSWATRRPTATAAAAYLLLSLLLFARGAGPGPDAVGLGLAVVGAAVAGQPARRRAGARLDFEQADAVTQFQPPLQAIRATLPDIPLWDPGTLSGRPLVADPQSQLFSPFSVPAYVLPFWKSLAVTAILKVFVGAFGAFLLGSALGMRFAGALLTGWSSGSASGR